MTLMLGPRAVFEPTTVVRRLAASWQLTEAEVSHRLAQAHDVVDDWITTDITVYLPSLMFGEWRHPVLRPLAEYVESADHDRLGAEDSDALAALIHGLMLYNQRGLHGVIGVPARTVDQFPIGGAFDLLVALQEQFGDTWVPENGEADLERLEEWFASYETPRGPRSYQVRPAGLERDFESWLVSDLSRIPDVGTCITLDDPHPFIGRQRRLPNGLVPDLVCRFTAAAGTAEPGDVLVIENKATRVNSLALDQLTRYVGALRALMPDVTVHGMLIADGRSLNLQRQLVEQDYAYWSLTDLGYRQHLRSQAVHPVEWDTSESSAPILTSRVPD